MGVGEKLQEERLRQGFTLEEIEEETKIRKYYLQALEEESVGISRKTSRLGGSL